MGRPSTFSEEKAGEILERVASGEPLAQVLRDPGMPRLSTWYDWVRKDDELAGRFGRAREAGFDHIAAECIEIADFGGNDPQLARVRIETRLKLLAKWDPRRYGDVQQVRLADHEGKSLRDVSESEAAARVAAILEAARRRSAPLLGSVQSGADSQPWADT